MPENKDAFINDLNGQMFMEQMKNRERKKDMPHQLMQFFSYEHLPEHLQTVSKPFCELAQKIDSELPGNPEKTVALRKLLESKDCAVRSILFEG